MTPQDVGDVLVLALGKRALIDRADERVDACRIDGVRDRELAVLFECRALGG